MKMIIDILQMEGLDVNGALLAMGETKESLERFRNDERPIDNEVQAACLLVKQFDVDAESEFRRVHRTRVPPKCLDATPRTGVSLTMDMFYRKEVFSFLNSMVNVLSPKIDSLETSLRSLIDVLDPNITTVFPNDVPDPYMLATVMEVFMSYCEKEKEKFVPTSIFHSLKQTVSHSKSSDIRPAPNCPNPAKFE